MNKEDVWLNFLRGTGFPRDIGIFERIKVNNEEEYFNVINTYNGKRHIAVQVYSDNQIKNNEIDTIFLDFDLIIHKQLVGNLQDLLNEVMKLRNKFNGRLYFTGSKGFHLYIDIKPIRDENIKPIVQEWIRRNINLKYFDRHSMGDLKRIARIPYTVNINTGVFMVPVIYQNVSDLLDYALNPNNHYYDYEIIRNDEVYNELMEIKESGEYQIEDDSLTNNNNNNRMSLRDFEFPYCIRKYIENLRKNGELSHFERFQLAIFLLRCGMPEAEVIELFKSAKDFNLQKTKYQIEYFIKRNMKNMTCKKAKSYGLCDLEVQELCPYYPSINKVLKELNGVIK